jgi:hypothetical protein
MAASVPRYDVFSPNGNDEFYEYKTMSGVLPNRKVAPCASIRVSSNGTSKPAVSAKTSSRLRPAIATSVW